MQLHLDRIREEWEYVSFCQERFKLSSTAYILYPFAKLSQRSADNRDILSVPYN